MPGKLKELASSPLSAPEDELEQEFGLLLEEPDMFCHTGTLDWISKDVCCPAHCVDPLSGEPGLWRRKMSNIWR